jgi:hypothetical protein
LGHRRSFPLAAGDVFSISFGGFDDKQSFGAQVALRRRGVWPLAHTYAKKFGEGGIIFDHVGRGCPRRHCLAFPLSGDRCYGQNGLRPRERRATSSPSPSNPSSSACVAASPLGLLPPHLWRRSGRQTTPLVPQGACHWCWAVPRRVERGVTDRDNGPPRIAAVGWPASGFSAYACPARSCASDDGAGSRTVLTAALRVSGNM